ncbi:MAG: hypothetical protein CM15mP62_21310 [Rhodospirillaceae bacterium]|nr:MAG: hypothetical protein CM15mP62_21310 [Rhodospirillaceae bacterium]
MKFNIVFALVTTLAISAMPAVGETTIRATGLVSTHKFHTALEKQFYAELEDKTGIDLAINFNPLDVVGVDMQDTLRMVRTGAFDIVQSTIGAPLVTMHFLKELILLVYQPRWIS